jgi:hypothetical protein
MIQVEKEPMNIWSPRADLEAGAAAVLPVDPQLAIQVGQIQPVPILVGITESEGVWRAVNYLTQAGGGQRVLASGDGHDVVDRRRRDIGDEYEVVAVSYRQQVKSSRWHQVVGSM